MAADEIHVGDVGTQFLFTIHEGDTVIDVSSATVRNLTFKKPDGTTLTKAATFVLTGADGRIQYFSIAGDLDIEGLWSVQAYLEMATGKWYSDVAEFTVYPNLGS